MTAILKVDTIQDTAGNNIINESSDTITIGASGDTIALAGTTVTGITQGITMADVWRYTAATQQPSGLLSSNFERADDASSGNIGSAMTFSSGTWSFPITGIYLINASVGFNFANQQDNNANLVIGITNNNSSYDDVAIIFSGSNSSSNFSRFSQYGHAIVDVTDTAQVKMQITANSFESNSYLEGSTDRNDTAFSFIRLGDT